MSNTPDDRRERLSPEVSLQAPARKVSRLPSLLLVCALLAGVVALVLGLIL